jgi:cytochrome P450 family 135
VRVMSEPFEIGEHTIPPGYHVLVNSYGIHHDPALYPEPEALRPERFLNGTPEPYTWLPFGGGAHRCIGAALAELEIRLALAAMLERFDLEPSEAQPARAERRAITLVPRGGARVRLAPPTVSARTSVQIPVP